MSLTIEQEIARVQSVRAELTPYLHSGSISGLPAIGRLKLKMCDDAIRAANAARNSGNAGELAAALTTLQGII